MSVTDVTDDETSFHDTATTFRLPACSTLGSATVTVLSAVWGVAAATCTKVGDAPGTVVLGAVVVGAVVGGVVVVGAVVVVPGASSTRIQSDAPSPCVPGVVYGAVAACEVPVVGSNQRALNPGCSLVMSTLTV